MNNPFKSLFLVSMLLLLWSAPQANATLVNFSVSSDDYVVLTIGGGVICSYDAYPAGGCSGAFDMTPGTWYDITIDYKNRWGSNGLGLSWDQPEIDVGIWGSIVPETNLRSLDASGAFISGLHADYFNTSGGLLFSVEGEGPIAAGNADGTNTFYENQLGLWAGTYDFWGKFEEVLTGQIRISGVPEPATLVLMGLGLIGTGFSRRRKLIREPLS